MPNFCRRNNNDMGNDPRKVKSELEVINYGKGQEEKLEEVALVSLVKASDASLWLKEGLFVTFYYDDSDEIEK